MSGGRPSICNLMERTGNPQDASFNSSLDSVPKFKCGLQLMASALPLVFTLRSTLSGAGSWGAGGTATPLD